MQYSHTQHAPLPWIMLAIGVVIGLWTAVQGPWEAGLVIGLAFLAVALLFGYLTIYDDVQELVVRFGPLPLFGCRIPYAEIESFERSRTTFLDGWGIHWIPFRGWTFNLWGFSCVKLRLGGNVLRVGTDDTDNLMRLLARKVSAGDP